jgi:hypothetical protein
VEFAAKRDEINGDEHISVSIIDGAFRECQDAKIA